MLWTIIIITCITTLVFYFFRTKYRMVKTKSGREYYVEDLKGDREKKSAEILSEVNKRCEKLIKTLGSKYPRDKRTKKIIERYQWHDLREDDSSFTINKGSKIHIKIRDAHSYYSINTIMFVVLHELSHIVTPQYDLTFNHSKIFWNNNIWIMQNASEIGIFHPINYKLYPIKYGGGYINYNPMF